MWGLELFGGLARGLEEAFFFFFGMIGQLTRDHR
jgi:hypothetical protein